MTALHDPSQFEPLGDATWDETAAQQRIREIVADAEAAFDTAELWPSDEWDLWGCAPPLKNVYVGAAGVLWALDVLAGHGFGCDIDLAAGAERALELWREQPDFGGEEVLPNKPHSSLLSGETGVLLVAYRFGRDEANADALHARVLDNVGSGVNELMYGSPGTMHAARRMLDWTGDARWEDAWRASADDLWQTRDEEGLWTQELWGSRVRSLTAPHGLVGVVRALLDGRELLADDRREALLGEARRLLRDNAIVEDGNATWPLGHGRGVVGSDGETRLQWCGGAPSTLIGAYDYLDDDLLLAGANLIWAAGPHGLEKGSGICHGTAGNGFALLKTFARTGDEAWLDRARRFAMHALDQVERLHAQRGRGRYSLFTGDVGTALFAAACMDARADYPIVDYL